MVQINFHFFIVGSEINFFQLLTLCSDIILSSLLWHEVSNDIIRVLVFIPGAALPGLILLTTCSRGIHSPLFCVFRQLKRMLHRIHVSDWFWSLYNSPLLWLNSLNAVAICFGSLSVCTVKRHSISSESFDWIWADDQIAQNTSEFILLLLSAVPSSINTRKAVPLAVRHAQLAMEQPTVPLLLVP